MENQDSSTESSENLNHFRLLLGVDNLRITPKIFHSAHPICLVSINLNEKFDPDDFEFLSIPDLWIGRFRYGTIFAEDGSPMVKGVEIICSDQPTLSGSWETIKSRYKLPWSGNSFFLAA